MDTVLLAVQVLTHIKKYTQKMEKQFKLTSLANPDAEPVVVSERILRDTCGIAEHLFCDFGDAQDGETIPLPGITDTNALRLLYEQVWPKWSTDVREFNFRKIPKPDFNKTMAAWARQPSRFLLDFEKLTLKEQASFGQLGHYLDMPFLETLHMLSLVRHAQKCTNLSEWRPYVETVTQTKFTADEQKKAVVNAMSNFPFLVQVSPPSESCAEQPPRTGAKRRACEY
jgi:hypothetical protein